MNFYRKFKRFLQISASLSFFASSTALACPDIDGLLDINCDGKVEIICFGDSITYGTADPTGLGYPGRLRQLYPNVIVKNFGDPGERTPQGKNRAASTFAANSTGDFAIILEGVNDYWNSYSATTTKNNLLNMVSSGNGTTAITLLGSLTAVKRNFQQPWVNSVNAAINPFQNVDFFSLGESIISGDKLHPDAAGYLSMATYLSTILEAQTELNRPADNDNDGIYDFAEIQFGTQVGVPDSDSDGVLDGAEVFTYNSNPLVPDTDSDGILDGVEVSIGSDPTSALPTPPIAQSLQAVDPEI